MNDFQKEQLELQKKQMEMDKINGERALRLKCLELRFSKSASGDFPDYQIYDAQKMANFVLYGIEISKDK